MDKFLYMLMNGTILIAVILCFRFFFANKIPRRMMVIFWLFAIARLLLPVAVPIQWSVVHTQHQSAKFNNKLTDRAGFHQLFLIENMLGQMPEEESEEFKETGKTSQMPGKDSIGPKDRKGFSDIKGLKELLGMLWLVTAFLLAFKILAGHMQCRKIYCQSLPIEDEKAAEWLRFHESHCIHPSFRKVTLRQSEFIDSPLTYGILRPVILLPSNIELSEEEFLCIMEHEWTHIRWWDVLAKYLMYLAACIYWFHPIVWVMVILMNRDIESACDEEVMRKYPSSLKTTYALLLIRLAESRRGFLKPVNARFASHFEIEERIRLIMKPKKYTKKAAALAVGMICCAAASFTVSAQESTKNMNQENASHPLDVSVPRMEQDKIVKDPAESMTDIENIVIEDKVIEDKVIENKVIEDKEIKTKDETSSAKENNQIAKLAEDFIGAPYQFGGTDLNSGVDSIGFVQAIYEKAGVTLPGDISKLASSGTEVSLEELAAGDIIIYGQMDENDTMQLFHTGIYDGSGQVIHASNCRDGVKVSAFDYREICKAVRILN